jgi:hypothetical protein
MATDIPPWTSKSIEKRDPFATQTTDTAITTADLENA